VHSQSIHRLDCDCVHLCHLSFIVIARVIVLQYISRARPTVAKLLVMYWVNTPTFCTAVVGLYPTVANRYQCYVLCHRRAINISLESNQL